MAWEQFVQRWVPSGLDPAQQRQSRLIISSAFILAGVAALYIALYAATGAYLLVGLNLVAIVSCLVALPVVRRQAATVAANICTMGGYLCMASSLAISGGFEARFMFWLLVVPLMAGLLGGVATGIVWSVITGATLLSFVGLYVAEIPLPIIIPIEQPPAILITQTVGIVFVITVITVVFLRNQEWAEGQTHRAIMRLEGEVASRRRAEESAHAANQAKGDFLARMSHELRTPMTGIMGMIQLLTRTELTIEQQRLTSTVRESSDMLMDLLNGLLDFSKIEAGSLELDPRPFGLRSTLESAMELVAAGGQDKGLELLVEVDFALPSTLLADEMRLRQMLLNLLNNAIKFTEEGEVRLEARDEGQHVRFSVHDTGIGIPEEVQEELFSPFTQAEASTSRRFGGTGLGLAIVRSLAEEMGGEAGLNSSEGEGSEFWFTIRKDVPDEDLEPELELRTLRDRRILVVDDNASSRRILRGLLEHWGMKATVAADSTEALLSLHSAATQGEPFEWALLDMEMEIVGGLELSRRISEEPSLRSVRRLLLCAMGHQVPEELMRVTGIDGQLFKPLSARMLHDALQALWEGQEAEASVTAPVEPDDSAAISLEISEFRSRLADGLADEPPDDEVPEGGRGTILVVDDNRINQMVIKRVLTNLGYKSISVEDGQLALDRLRKESFDAVLMDVQMPGLDGYQTTGRIRNELRMELPVIGLTANASPDDRQRCLDAGMDDFLVKPIDIDAMRTALAKSVEGVEDPR